MSLASRWKLGRSVDTFQLASKLETAPVNTLTRRLLSQYGVPGRQSYNASAAYALRAVAVLDIELLRDLAPGHAFLTQRFDPGAGNEHSGTAQPLAFVACGGQACLYLPRYECVPAWPRWRK